MFQVNENTSLNPMQVLGIAVVQREKETEGYAVTVFTDDEENWWDIAEHLTEEEAQNTKEKKEQEWEESIARLMTDPFVNLLHYWKYHGQI